MDNYLLNLTVPSDRTSATNLCEVLGKENLHVLRVFYSLLNPIRYFVLLVIDGQFAAVLQRFWDFYDRIE